MDKPELRGRPPAGRGALAALAALLLLATSGCRRFVDQLWPATAPPPLSSGPRHWLHNGPDVPWLIVHPERVAGFDSGPAAQICFGGTAPRLLRGAPLDLPPEHPLRRAPYVFVVDCAIDQNGEVAKAQILKGPDTPTIRDAMVRSMRQWRFAPAMRDGQPWRAHFTVQVTLDGPISSPPPPARPGCR